MDLCPELKMKRCCVGSLTLIMYGFFHIFYHVLYACFANLPNKGGNYGRNMTYIPYWSIYYVDIYSMWLLRMGRLLEKTNLFFAIGNGINVKLISPYMSPHSSTTRIHAQVQISDTLYLLGRLAYAHSGRNTTKKLML